MSGVVMRTNVMMVCLLALSSSVQAAWLVQTGQSAHLTVEYQFKSTGSIHSKYDSKNWNIDRHATLVVELSAQKPQPLSAMKPMESTQLADLQNKQAHAQEASRKMAPMANDMMKIVEKCGEDEACITREVSAYGLSTQPSAEVKSARQDIAVVAKQNEPRYQQWAASKQSISFRVHDVENSAQTEVMEGGSGKKLTQIITRDCQGNDPTQHGVIGYEIDNQQDTITMLLSVVPVTCKQTVAGNLSTDENGTRQIAIWVTGNAEPFKGTMTIPLKGQDVRNQSGQQVYKLKDTDGHEGTLTINWRITAL